jgi:hypothetical protein
VPQQSVAAGVQQAEASAIGVGVLSQHPGGVDAQLAASSAFAMPP